MSGSGVYLIQSYIETTPPVGIAPPLPPEDGPGPVILEEPVHIKGSGDWRLTRQGDTDIYQFSILDRFEYTGVGDQNVVIATDNAANNKLWYVKKVGPERYIIALADDPTLGWTVPVLNSEANIVVLALPPDPSLSPYNYLFKLTKLHL